jgi:perosamine synthetase
MTKKQELLPVFRPNYGAEEIKAVTEVLKSGWIGLGPKTAEFEKRFASYVGVKYAVALNSCTAALHLALITAGVGPGDEVIVPALTFVSDVHAILYVGAKPVFADVEPDTLCLSPKDVARKITQKTKAIIPVHYGGHPCEMKELQQLAKPKIVIVEDAAHACGSAYHGRRIGSISPFTCFSFHAVKNLATGDGGMITTNNTKAAARLRRLRWCGIDADTWKREKHGLKLYSSYGWYYEIKELGYKCHMNDIAAALGLVQLQKLEKVNRRRRQLAAIYTKELSKLPGIECPVIRSGVVTAQHNYVIRCDFRDKLNLYLQGKYISTGVHYLPIHLQPFYRKLYPNVHLPVTEAQWSRLLTLPLYPSLTNKGFDYIIESIKKFGHNN